MNSSFWLELLVRSTALLLVGALVLRIVRSANPAAKHRFLLCAFALLAVLPLLAAFLPDIPLSIWKPESARKALVTVLEVSPRTVEPSASPVVNWLMLTWMIGVALSCLPLILGGLSVWRLARRARPITDEIAISLDSRIPMTCGILHPRILLPAEAEHWSPSRWNAVLLHERAHIRRRDVAAQIAVHLVASLWWFQPLVWVMRRRLRTESELAADAEAIRSGLRASDYASELLAVARATGGSWRMPMSAIATVGSSNLEARMRAMLYPSSATLRPARIFVCGLILGSAAIAASAVTFHFHESSNSSGGSIMKRTILSALLTSAGLSAASISGTVHDGKGDTIADAKVVITNPDTGDKQDAVTTSDGRFSFTGAGAGQYILRIEKAGFTSIFREFDVKAESNMQRDLTMPNEGGQAVPDKVVAVNEEPANNKIRVGGRVAESNLVRKVQPVYPPAAKAAGIQGTVQLEVTISKDGVPTEIRVVSSPDDDLSASALEAVRQWRYRPTLLNGNPVGIVTLVIVNYTLAQ